MSEEKKAAPSVGVRVIKARDQQPVAKAEAPTAVDPDRERSAGEFVTPPYDMRGLKQMARDSNILPQCITAYKNNIAGFGIALRYKTEDAEETPEMKAEWDAAQQVLDLLTVNMDTKEVFEDLIEGRETYGIAYLEVIRNPAGEVNQVSFIRDIPSIQKTYPLDPPQDAVYMYNGQEVKRPRRFCKYRQQVAGSTVYFKELGDPRMMDSRSGEYTALDSDGEALPIQYQANEILEFSIGTELYGEVRWLGQVLGIDGSRKAESLNNRYFTEGRHTPMMICVNGGTLTDDSFAKLQEYMNDIKGEAGQHAFLVLEVENTDNKAAFEESQKPNIEVKDLASILQKDELFQDYLENNRRRVQSAFRLPDLYTGYTTDFNRATAQTAMEVTEKQVFQPERKSLAWAINNMLLNGYGFKYVEAYFLEPDISNVDDLFKILTITEKAGGLTPNKARMIVAEALGEQAENYEGDWGDTPLVMQSFLAQNQTVMPQLDAQIQKAVGNHDDEIVAVMKEVRSLLKKAFTNDQKNPIMKTDEDGWKTINGTKVHFGDDGNIDMGPQGLKDWSSADASDSGGAGDSSGSSSESVLTKSAESWQKDLSRAERKGLSVYTGDFYEDINDWLRSGMEDDDEYLEDFVDNIDSAIEKFETTEDVVVYRGVSSQVIRQYGNKLDESIVGKDFWDPGYMSTSIDSVQAEKFANDHASESRGKPVLLKLEIPSGTGRGAYVGGVSEHAEEKEFLLRRDATFTFTSFEERADGMIVLGARWSE